VTDPSDRKADSTRQHIVCAAAHQFAHTPYSMVSLEDILAEARVTKGAMYFHFRSKYALALAIIDAASKAGWDAANELLARKLSGLETLIDITYMMADYDITSEISRAGLHLLESIGRTDGLQGKVLGDWVRGFAAVVGRGITEGDVLPHHDPEDVGRQLLSLYMGIRQTCDLDQPDQFLKTLETAWFLMLPGIANPDRISYFTQFIGRRTTLAINKGSVPIGSA
jgi:TetR/AcrR family transcriptional regulator, transcriptional repressor for nem operon